MRFRRKMPSFVSPFLRPLFLRCSSGLAQCRNSPAWAGKFLEQWCRQTMRSRIEPMKKIARSLRQHRELILNYFRAQKLISSGVVEGLNNKAKVTMRKSYGFRTYRVLELALYHSLGKLPEPESTHDFF
jgi:transposase